MQEYDASNDKGFRPYKGDVWSVHWIQSGTNERCEEAYRDERKAKCAPWEKSYGPIPETIQIVKNPVCWADFEIVGWNGQIEPPLGAAA